MNTPINACLKWNIDFILLDALIHKVLDAYIS